MMKAESHRKQTYAFGDSSAARRNRNRARVVGGTLFVDAPD
jgi:hypothetical protein